MPVLDESKAVRRAALDDGLLEVLIRLSGDSEILKKLKVPNADAYVKQFEYLAAEQKPNSEDGLQRLWVRYNETKVMDFLRQQAVPIWSEHRVQTVVWLAVRDAGQRYILKEDDVSVIKTNAEKIFARRGIPVIWPKNDALDQEVVRFADVWAGFSGPLQQASKRYSSGPVISANLEWDGRAWNGEWLLLIGDEARKWRLSGADYASLIARATDLTADIMGQKYAVLETLDSSQQQQITVEIDQVSSVEDFRRIEKYLSSLSAVKSILLSQVEPGRVFYELTLRTKADDLLRLIESGKTMSLIVDDANTIGGEGIIADMPLATSQAGEQAAETQAAPLPKQSDYRFVLR